MMFFFFAHQFNIITHHESWDVLHIPQNLSVYVKNIRPHKMPNNGFREKFFKPWNICSFPSVDHLERIKEGFGANLKPYDNQWYKNQKHNMQYNKLNTLKKHGIITRSTDLRALPTVEPLFYDPATAGEGYPFDNNQYSYLPVGSPIFISHLSSDEAWAFVYTYERIYGWVSALDFAFMTEQECRHYEKQNFVAVIKDKSILKDPVGNFMAYGRVGMILPQNLIPTRDIDGRMLLKEVEINASDVQPLPIAWNSKTVEKILSNFMGEIYGWGGYLGHRDCSLMVRDFFMPFGLLIPRNTKGQSTLDGFDLSGKTPAEKKKFLQQKGVPFRTLLLAPGHVGLFVGMYHNEPIMLHNVWVGGVHTSFEGKKGRNPIGRTVFSTLEYLKEIPYTDPDTLFLMRLNKMVVL